MGDWVSFESFWTVVTLLVLWLESGSSWTGDTFLSVPEWLIVWAFAIIVKPNFTSTAFAFFGVRVDGPGGVAFTFACFGCGVEFGSSGAGSALFGGRVKKLSSGGIALDTVVGDFIITILAF